MQLTTPLCVSLLAASVFASAPVNNGALSGQQVLTSSSDPFEDIKKALAKANITGNIVDDFEPKCFVQPFYGKKEKAVILGNKIKAYKAKHKPTVHVVCPNMTQTTGMTVVLSDPDAPSRENPKWGEMAHWIASVEAFATTADAETVSMSKSHDILKYKAPAPPKGTGHHRYVFILLEGVNTNLTVPHDRQHWGFEGAGQGVQDWANQEGLTVVGANFFYAKNKKD